MTLTIDSSVTIGSGSGSSGAAQAQNFAAGGKLVTMGDSQNALGTSVTATTRDMQSRGAMTWARRYSKQSLIYTPDLNVAVGGTTWGAYDTQMPLALALNPDFIMTNWGINDSVGATGAAMTLAKTNAARFIVDSFAAGVTPILQMLPPRSDASGTAAALAWIDSYNRFLMDLCSMRDDLVTLYNLPKHRTPILVTCERYPAYGATNGTSNPGMIGSDGLHKDMGGGIYEGYQIAQAIEKLRPPVPKSYCSPYNKYDATNNPNGNLFVFSSTNRGMFQGTGGTLSTNGGITPTGSIAPNCQLTAQNTITSTGTTAVAYKENPRTDGLISGEGQGIRLTSTGGAGAGAEVFQFNLVNGVQGIRTGFSAGDVVVFRMKVKIKTCVGLLNLNFTLNEGGPASPRSYSDGGTTVNTVPVSAANFPELLIPFYIETQPLTLQSGIVDIFAKTIMTLDGAGSSYDLDVVFYDAVVHKIN